MSTPLLVEDFDEGVRVLTLNRPKNLNALNGELVEALVEALERAAGESPDVKVLVLRGAGRSFCAGADLKWLASGVLADHGAHVRFQENLAKVCALLEEVPQVTLGAVHGHVLAGGLEILLGCDLILAAEDAAIGDEHIKRNLLPGGGGSQRLPRRIGLSRGLFHLLTGRRMTGVQAAEYGLAFAAVPYGELDRTAYDVAREVGARDGHALKYMKQLARHGLEMAQKDALAWELWTQSKYRAESSAMDAGVAAFGDKSPA